MRNVSLNETESALCALCMNLRLFILDGSAHGGILFQLDDFQAINDIISLDSTDVAQDDDLAMIEPTLNQLAFTVSTLSTSSLSPSVHSQPAHFHRQYTLNQLAFTVSSLSSSSLSVTVHSQAARFHRQYIFN